MILRNIEAGPLGANCYILMDEDTKDTVIMDPGGNADDIEREIEKLGARFKFIILTHGHFDHVGGVNALASKYNIPIYISKVDLEYTKKDTTEIFGKLPQICKTIAEGDILTFGKYKINILETPGHTEGGLSFYVDGKVFTGDTLFRGSVGRTDFLGGSYEDIINSIKTKILPLGDDIEVYPGHGPMSSVGYEKRNNPYLD